MTRSLRVLALIALVLALLPAGQSRAASDLSASYVVQPDSAATVVAGSMTQFTVNVTNTGSATWGGTILLAYHLYDASGNVVVWDGKRSGFTTPVAPGASATVNATVVAPLQAGDYVLRFALVDEGVAWFDAEPGSRALHVSPAVWSAQVAAAPGAASVDASATLPVHLTLTNTGNVAWSSNSTLPSQTLSYHWRDASGTTVVWDGQRYPIALAPGASTTLDVNVMPPGHPGTYTLVFAVVNEGVAWIPTTTAPLTIAVTDKSSVGVALDTSALAAAGMYDRPLTLTNTGALTIPAGTFASLEWDNPDGTVFATESYNLGTLAADLAPGASASFLAVFDAPWVPGTYTLVTKLGGRAIDTRAIALSAGGLTARYALGAGLSSLAAGQTQTIPVSITNSTASFIRAWSPTVFAHWADVSYHWYDSAGNLLVWDGARTQLAQDIAPGASTTVSLAVRTPAAPGQYTLVVDLVEEGVTWFADDGATPLRIPVSVGWGISASYSGFPYMQPSYVVGSTQLLYTDITNTGGATWSVQQPYRCSYHIFDSAGNVVVWDGIRSMSTTGQLLASSSYLPGTDVAPGQTFRCGFAIPMPATTGTYTIGWDMVVEGQFWFSSIGVPMKLQTFRIVNAPVLTPGPTPCPTLAPTPTPSPGATYDPTAPSLGGNAPCSWQPSSAP